MESLESARKPRYRGTLLPGIVFLVSVCIVLAILANLFLPSIGRGRLPPCTNNLKLIGIALQNYHDEFGCFPPACTFDEAGKPMHSWRVLILPYCCDGEAHHAYQEYRFDEPWNGPTNRKLAEAMPDVFLCPGSEAGENEANYVAVVGQETAWPRDKSMSVRDVHDGSPRTMLLVEIANSGINWLEPRDLSFEQAVQGINPPHVNLSISSNHRGGANTLFCDGSVFFLSDEVPADTLRALLTASGGEDVAIPD